MACGENNLRCPSPGELSLLFFVKEALALGVLDYLHSTDSFVRGDSDSAFARFLCHPILGFSQEKT